MYLGLPAVFEREFVSVFVRVLPVPCNYLVDHDFFLTKAPLTSRASLSLTSGIALSFGVSRILGPA